MYLAVKLTLKTPITAKGVCFCHLLKCFRIFFNKQCRPISDCSCNNSLIWVHTVCPYTYVSRLLLAKRISSAHREHVLISTVNFRVTVNLMVHFHCNYPHAFLKKAKGILQLPPSVRLSVMLSPPKPFNEIQTNLVCE